MTNEMKYYGKTANVSVDVPFSWCQECKAMEIYEGKIYNGTTDYIVVRKCHHAIECCACEDARKKVYDNGIRYEQR